MARRVVQTKAITLDREKLVVVTVYEEEVNKEQVKALEILSKAHDVLIKRAERYEFR